LIARALSKRIHYRFLVTPAPAASSKRRPPADRNGAGIAGAMGYAERVYYRA